MDGNITAIYCGGAVCTGTNAVLIIQEIIKKIAPGAGNELPNKRVRKRDRLVFVVVIVVVLYNKNDPSIAPRTSVILLNCGVNKNEHFILVEHFVSVEFGN